MRLTKLAGIAFYLLTSYTTFASNLEANAQSVFTFVSSPRDFVGQGKTVFLTTKEVTLSPMDVPSRDRVYLYLNNYVQKQPNDPFIDWTVSFYAPNGAPLTIGMYKDARRFPGDKPSLSVYGNGRGCNENYGSFEVLQITYDNFGALKNFAADFVQRCESPTAYPLFGAIRYNSSVPLPKL